MRIAEFSAELLYKQKGEDQSADFFYKAVEIPLCMKSLTVTVTTHSSSYAQIPFALFSPDSEIRILKTSEGGSGDYSASCTIGERASDRGGLSGPIGSGTWRLILQKRRFSEDILADVVIEGDPVAASSEPFVQKTDDKAAPRAGAGWYRGELHVHSDHSTGRDTIPDIIRVAEKAGLDFIAITDHFTISHWEEERALADSPVLIIQSMELSGNRGHANLHGIRTMKNPYVDDDGTLASFFGVDKLPDMSDVADSVHSESGLFCINHPDSNIASAWRYHEFPVRKADLIEVWCTSEGGFSMRYPAIWDQYLMQGIHLTGVCSSDSHKAEDHPFWSLGRIMTHVYADELSEKGIIDGLRRGNAFMAKGDSLLDFHASDSGHTVNMGESVMDLENAVFHVRLMNHPAGNLFIYLTGQLHDIVRFSEDDEDYAFSVSPGCVGSGECQYIRLEFYDELASPRFWGDTPRSQDALRLMSNPIYFSKE